MNQLTLGIQSPSHEPAAQRPPLPSGDYRIARTWDELIDRKGKEWKYNNRTGEYEIVRHYRVEIMVVFTGTKWRSVQKVCKRPVKKSVEHYCILEDGTGWPAENLGSYAVREIDIEEPGDE